MDYSDAKKLKERLKEELKRKIKYLGIESQFLKFHETQSEQSLQYLGIGIHKDENNENYKVAIRVESEKDSDIIQKLVDQSTLNQIDLRVIGKVYAKAYTQESTFLEKLTRPLRLGASIGYMDITTGTLGCFVRDPNNPDQTLILSNNHVLANENHTTENAPITQPTKADGGGLPQYQVASLYKYIPLQFGENTINQVDAAVAAINEGVDNEPNEIPDAVSLRGLYSNPQNTLLGKVVVKQGRTTGLTYGRITTIELDDILIKYVKGKCVFNGLIEIEGINQRDSSEPGDSSVFSRPGDSGSLIIDTDGNAVGLLFAGNEQENISFATPIEIVLKNLDVELILNN
jgi:hypothetical protein